MCVSPDNRFEVSVVNNQVELAFGRVVKRIEPLTRFDRSSLRQESECVRVATGKAFWRFYPSISDSREEHTDRLPYHAERVDSAEKLDEIAQRTLRAAQQALPRRIEAWLQANYATDRKLEPSNCFDGPEVFGHEYKCRDCLGDGWVKCGGCQSGYNDCPPCGNKGYVDCSHCSGLIFGSSGKERCKGCGGSGKRDGHACPTCNGRGKVVCHVCRGAKTVTCGKCKGAGRLAHSPCNATGRLTCRPCRGTGHFHVLRTVACAVREHFSVDLRDAKSEVVEQLVRRDLAALRTLASVTQKPPTVRDDVVEREYQVECIITEIGLQVAGRKLELLGFGGKAEIFDFKKIVPIILNADLFTLEQAVAKTPLRLWGDPAELVKATSQFLDSEVNVRIDDPALLKDGTVDRAYVGRVKTVVPAALRRVAAAHLGLAFLVTALAPTILFLTCHFAGVPEMIGGWVFAPPAVAAVTSWELLERRTRSRLRTILNDAAGKKVPPLLRKYYILWSARGGALAATATLLAVAAALTLP